jgi:hypothetical protein
VAGPAGRVRGRSSGVVVAAAMMSAGVLGAGTTPNTEPTSAMRSKYP